MIRVDDAVLEVLAERLAEKVAAKLATVRVTDRSATGFQSLETVAAALGVSSGYLRRLARTGRLPGVLRAGRVWRARREDVEAALRAPMPLSNDHRNVVVLAQAHLARHAGGGR